MTQRSIFKQQRHQIDPLTQQLASEKIIAQLKPLLQDKQHIAAYWAIHGEINLINLLNELCFEKNIYLPVVQPMGFLEFAAYHSNLSLRENQYHIFEPEAHHPAAFYPAEALDVVLVPLLACDHRGFRLGMGGGYYDKTFAFLNQEKRPNHPQLIGVGYDFQYVNRLPQNPWDVRLDGLVTELRICWF